MAIIVSPGDPHQLIISPTGEIKSGRPVENRSFVSPKSEHLIIESFIRCYQKALNSLSLQKLQEIAALSGVGIARGTRNPIFILPILNKVECWENKCRASILIGFPIVGNEASSMDAWRRIARRFALPCITTSKGLVAEIEISSPSVVVEVGSLTNPPLQRWLLQKEEWPEVREKLRNCERSFDLLSAI